MIDDRPMGKLSFRHWLVRVAIQTIFTPEYGQELIRSAVRSRTPLPLVICRRAETLASASSAPCCLTRRAGPMMAARPPSGSGKPTTATPPDNPLSSVFRSCMAFYCPTAHLVMRQSLTII